MLESEKRFYSDQELDDFWSGKVNYARGITYNSEKISQNNKKRKNIELKSNDTIKFECNDKKTRKARRISRWN